MPFYVMIITGLKPWQMSMSPACGICRKGCISEVSLQAWALVSPNFWNSMIITIPAALISSMIGSINGYIFAKWRFRGSDTIFILFLVGMFLPYQGILIPLVLTLQAVDLYGNRHRADHGALHLWHPDHGAALPRLLCRYPQ